MAPAENSQAAVPLQAVRGFLTSFRNDTTKTKAAQTSAAPLLLNLSYTS
jgi:hypothetical protein